MRAPKVTKKQLSLEEDDEEDEQGPRNRKEMNLKPKVDKKQKRKLSAQKNKNALLKTFQQQMGDFKPPVKEKSKEEIEKDKWDEEVVKPTKPVAAAAAAAEEEVK